MTKLNEIAEIITGYTMRSAPSYSRLSNLRIIQAQNITPGLYLNADELHQVHLENISINSSYVKSGDVILASRGRFHANVVKANQEILATSSVYIIRPSNNSVKPEFLAVYLNSSSAQKAFNKVSSGGSIKSLLRGDLEQLEIPLPTTKVQDTVVSIAKNIEAQSSLLERKNQLNEELIEGTLNNIIDQA